ncbi:hypothetical protein Gogos_020359, partial [Gossypium gossypioides]|nr:hypothetical protein [Gossypium gossypioides]
PNKGPLGKRATPAAKSGPESDGQLPYVSTQDDHNQVQSNSCFNVVCFENFYGLSAVGANASGLEPSMQANEFDGIKAHFNLTFEGPVGVAVQLHESCFKFTGNSHIPLVESMEAVVILISSKMVNETGNGAQDEAASYLNGVADSQQ